MQVLKRVARIAILILSLLGVATTGRTPSTR
jgi:hypothetical protein